MTTLTSNYDQFKKDAAANTSTTKSSGGTKSYDQFVQEMNSAGIKTTSIREGKEANFADYGNALSDDLKNLITDSFDCAQDYELQSLIAGVFADSGKNYLHRSDFVSACKQLGLNVKVDSYKTTYIPDYKGGNFSNSIRNGSVPVYTISDGMGGEIVIADANGNGALESEELFMNQILGDINYEISATKGVGVTIYSGGSGSGSNSVSGTEDGKSVFGVAETEKENKAKQVEYNTLVEKFLNNGSTMDEAMRKADTQLKVDNLTYSGSMKEKTTEKTDVEKTAKETVAKETKDKNIIDKTVDTTVAKTEKTDDKETVIDFSKEIAEDLIYEENIFAL